MSDIENLTPDEIRAIQNYNTMVRNFGATNAESLTQLGRNAAQAYQDYARRDAGANNVLTNDVGGVRYEPGSLGYSLGANKAIIDKHAGDNQTALRRVGKGVVNIGTSLVENAAATALGMAKYSIASPSTLLNYNQYRARENLKEAYEKLQVAKSNYERIKQEQDKAISDKSEIINELGAPKAGVSLEVRENVDKNLADTTSALTDAEQAYKEAQAEYDSAVSSLEFANTLYNAVDTESMMNGVSDIARSIRDAVKTDGELQAEKYFNLTNAYNKANTQALNLAREKKHPNDVISNGAAYLVNQAIDFFEDTNRNPNGWENLATIGTGQVIGSLGSAGFFAKVLPRLAAKIPKLGAKIAPKIGLKTSAFLTSMAAEGETNAAEVQRSIESLPTEVLLQDPDVLSMYNELKRQGLSDELAATTIKKQLSTAASNYVFWTQGPLAAVADTAADVSFFKAAFPNKFGDVSKNAGKFDDAVRAKTGNTETPTAANADKVDTAAPKTETPNEAKAESVAEDMNVSDANTNSLSSQFDKGISQLKNLSKNPSSLAAIAASTGREAITEAFQGGTESVNKNYFEREYGNTTKKDLLEDAGYNAAESAASAGLGHLATLGTVNAAPIAKSVAQKVTTGAGKVLDYVNEISSKETNNEDTGEISEEQQSEIQQRINKLRDETIIRNGDTVIINTEALDKEGLNQEEKDSFIKEFSKGAKNVKTVNYTDFNKYADEESAQLSAMAVDDQAASKLDKPIPNGGLKLVASNYGLKNSTYGELISDFYNNDEAREKILNDARKGNKLVANVLLNQIMRYTKATQSFVKDKEISRLDSNIEKLGSWLEANQQDTENPTYKTTKSLFDASKAVQDTLKNKSEIVKAVDTEFAETYKKHTARVNDILKQRADANTSAAINNISQFSQDGLSLNTRKDIANVVNSTNGLTVASKLTRDNKINYGSKNANTAVSNLAEASQQLASYITQLSDNKSKNKKNRVRRDIVVGDSENKARKSMKDYALESMRNSLNYAFTSNVEYLNKYKNLSDNLNNFVQSQKNKLAALEKFRSSSPEERAGYENEDGNYEYKFEAYNPASKEFFEQTLVTKKIKISDNTVPTPLEESISQEINLLSNLRDSIDSAYEELTSTLENDIESVSQEEANNEEQTAASNANSTDNSATTTVSEPNEVNTQSEPVSDKDTSQSTATDTDTNTGTDNTSEDSSFKPEGTVVKADMATLDNSSEEPALEDTLDDSELRDKSADKDGSTLAKALTNIVNISKFSEVLKNNTSLANITETELQDKYKDMGGKLRIHNPLNLGANLDKVPVNRFNYIASNILRMHFKRRNPLKSDMGSRYTLQKAFGDIFNLISQERALKEKYKTNYKESPSSHIEYISLKKVINFARVRIESSLNKILDDYLNAVNNNPEFKNKLIENPFSALQYTRNNGLLSFLVLDANGNFSFSPDLRSKLGIVAGATLGYLANKSSNKNIEHAREESSDDSADSFSDTTEGEVDNLNVESFIQRAVKDTFNITEGNNTAIPSNLISTLGIISLGALTNSELVNENNLYRYIDSKKGTMSLSTEKKEGYFKTTTYSFNIDKFITSAQQNSSNNLFQDSYHTLFNKIKPFSETSEKLSKEDMNKALENSRVYNKAKKEILHAITISVGKYYPVFTDTSFEAHNNQALSLDSLFEPQYFNDKAPPKVSVRTPLHRRTKLTRFQLKTLRDVNATEYHIDSEMANVVTNDDFYGKTRKFLGMESVFTEQNTTPEAFNLIPKRYESSLLAKEDLYDRSRDYIGFQLTKAKELVEDNTHPEIKTIDDVVKYYDHVMTSQGRIMPVDPMNPTANKLIRGVIVPTKAVTINTDDNTAMTLAKEAILFCFGAKTDKDNPAKLDETFEKYATDLDTFVKEDKNPLTDLEQYGKLLDTLESMDVDRTTLSIRAAADIINLLKATEKSAETGKPATFKFSTVLEIDGVNNGPANALILYALKLLQGQHTYPVTEPDEKPKKENLSLRRLLGNMGISLGRKASNNELKSNKDISDLYTMSANYTSQALTAKFLDTTKYQKLLNTPNSALSQDEKEKISNLKALYNDYHKFFVSSLGIAFEKLREPGISGAEIVDNVITIVRNGIKQLVTALSYGGTAQAATSNMVKNADRYFLTRVSTALINIEKLINKLADSKAEKQSVDFKTNILNISSERKGSLPLDMLAFIENNEQLDVFYNWVARGAPTGSKRTKKERKVISSLESKAEDFRNRTLGIISSAMGRPSYALLNNPVFKLNNLSKDTVSNSTEALNFGQYFHTLDEVKRDAQIGDYELFNRSISILSNLGATTEFINIPSNVFNIAPNQAINGLKAFSSSLNKSRINPTNKNEEEDFANMARKYVKGYSTNDENASEINELFFFEGKLNDSFKNISGVFDLLIADVFSNNDININPFIDNKFYTEFVKEFNVQEKLINARGLIYSSFFDTFATTAIESTQEAFGIDPNTALAFEKAISNATFNVFNTLKDVIYKILTNEQEYNEISAVASQDSDLNSAIISSTFGDKTTLADMIARDILSGNFKKYESLNNKLSELLKTTSPVFTITRNGIDYANVNFIKESFLDPNENKKPDPLKVLLPGGQKNSVNAGVKWNLPMFEGSRVNLAHPGVSFASISLVNTGEASVMGELQQSLRRDGINAGNVYDGVPGGSQDMLNISTQANENAIKVWTNINRYAELYDHYQRIENLNNVLRDNYGVSSYSAKNNVKDMNTADINKATLLDAALQKYGHDAAVNFIGYSSDQYAGVVGYFGNNDLIPATGLVAEGYEFTESQFNYLYNDIRDNIYQKLLNLTKNVPKLQLTTGEMSKNIKSAINDVVTKTSNAVHSEDAATAYKIAGKTLKPKNKSKKQRLAEKLTTIEQIQSLISSGSKGIELVKNYFAKSLNGAISLIREKDDTKYLKQSKQDLRLTLDRALKLTKKSDVLNIKKILGTRLKSANMNIIPAESLDFLVKEYFVTEEQERSLRENNTPAYFDSSLNSIVIIEDVFNQKTEEEKSEILMHEMLHGISTNLIFNHYMNNKSSESVKFFEDIYKRLTPPANGKSYTTEELYSGVNELVANIHQNYLSKSAYKLIDDGTGYTTNSALGELINSVNENEEDSKSFWKKIDSFLNAANIIINLTKLNKDIKGFSKNERTSQNVGIAQSHKLKAVIANQLVNLLQEAATLDNIITPAEFRTAAANNISPYTNNSALRDGRIKNAINTASKSGIEFDPNLFAKLAEDMLVAERTLENININEYFKNIIDNISDLNLTKKQENWINNYHPKNSKDLSPVIMIISLLGSSTNFNQDVSQFKGLNFTKTNTLGRSLLDDLFTKIGNGFLNAVITGKVTSKPSILNNAISLANRRNALSMFGTSLSRKTENISAAINDYISDIVASSEGFLMKYPKIKGIMVSAKNFSNAEAVFSLMNSLTKEASTGLFASLLKDLYGRNKVTDALYTLLKLSKAYVQKTRQTYRKLAPAVVLRKFKHLSQEEWDTFARAIKLVRFSNNFNYHKALLMNGNELRSSIDSTLLDIDIRLSDLYPDNTDSNRVANIIMKYVNNRVKGEPTIYRNSIAVANDIIYSQARYVSNKTLALADAIDTLIALQSIRDMNSNDRSVMTKIAKNNKAGIEYIQSLMAKVKSEEIKAALGSDAIYNADFGSLPNKAKLDTSVILVDSSTVENYKKKGYSVVRNYDTKGLKSLINPAESYLDTFKKVWMARSFNPEGNFEQGSIQIITPSVGNVDLHSGKPIGATGGIFGKGYAHKFVNTYKVSGKLKVGNDLMQPLFNKNGQLIGLERLVPDDMKEYLQYDTFIPTLIGIKLGSMQEMKTAQELNIKIIDECFNVYNDTVTKNRFRRNEFIDVFHSNDPIIKDAVRMFPSYLRKAIADRFPEGTFYVRKDMVNDVIGERAASVGDFWTGISRWSPTTQKHMTRALETLFGKNCLEKLVKLENKVMSVSTTAREWIIVKSVVVPMFNAMSTMMQLMLRGVSPFRIAASIPKKLAEIETYNRLFNENIELELQKMEVSGIKEKAIQRKIEANNETISKLSIAPLIERGEFSTIADLGVTNEDINVGDKNFFDKIEDRINKIPNHLLRNTARYAYMTKDTVLYRSLFKTVQYTDFIGKAIYLDFLTEKKKVSQEDALITIADEFVDYDRHMGRNRAWLENIGLLWFYNYKIRSVRTALSMLKNNPFQALVYSMLPAYGMGIGNPLIDNAAYSILDGRFNLGPGMILNGAFSHPTLELLGVSNL